MRRMPGCIDRPYREPVSFSGSIVLPNARELDVMITNVSDQGCQVTCEERLPIGKLVRLQLEGHDGVDAMVRWALTGAAGLQFLPREDAWPL